MDFEFQKLLDTHWAWQKGIFVTEVKTVDGIDYYFGPINSEFFNLAEPKTPNINLQLIEDEFSKRERVTSFYLTENIQKNGILEYLIRKGYSYAGGDTWMILDPKSYKHENSNSEIVRITEDTFKDYYSVLSVVFSDFSGNEKYLEICKNTISGKIPLNSFSDLKSELFLIYDKDKPAAGAGMFYSKEGDFAYLHDAGTLEEFRGKGYQSDLIKYRSNKALGLGISRIYSIVELGGQSWKNMINNGFSQQQLAYIIAKK